MIYHYPNLPDYSASVSYHRNKIGPSYFVVYYRGVSKVAFDRVSVKRIFGSARFLDSTTQLGVWCDEMTSKGHGSSPEGGRADTSFASEATLGESSEEIEDTSPTKMII